MGALGTITVRILQSVKAAGISTNFMNTPYPTIYFLNKL